MNRRRLLFLTYYVGAVVLIAVLMGQSYWVTSYRLAKGGITAQATVIRTNCGDRSNFSYRFSVDGRSIEGSGSAGYGTPPCSALKPGDQVPVNYLALAPQTNLPGNPGERLANETASIAMVAIFVPLVIIFLIFLILKRRDANSG